nr:BamA/TamA family outer membrane protein [Saprospiraceae bacterium]
MIWTVMCLNGLQSQTIYFELHTEAESQLLEDFPTRANDEGKAMLSLNSWLMDKRAEGHLAASIDQLVKKDSIWEVFLYLGAQYRWAKIEMGDIPQRWINAAGLRGEFFEGNTISRDDLLTLYRVLIEVAEQNGHPFAAVKLDRFEVVDSVILGKLSLDPGPLIYFDGVEVSGNLDIAPYYLASYLDVKPGTPYNAQHVYSLKNRLEELPFVGLLSDPTVRFKENRALVVLELESLNASRIDLVLGFLPGDELDQRLVITGNITGEFFNQLGLGERIFLDFQRLRPQTQDLELAFTYPYFLDLPFGLDTRFELSRRDSLFLDLGFYGGLEYMFSGSSSIRLFLDNRRSTLLSIDEESLLATEALPDRLDYSRTGIGLAYQLNRHDFRLNPTSGWSLITDLSIGQRKIKKNEQILNLSNESIDFDALYDSISLQTTVFNLGLTLNRFFPIGSIMTLKAELNTAVIYSDEQILFNELYRIGGNKLLRGFDEESVFASAYALSTLEYRLLTGRRSYFFTFFDLGYIENKSINAQLSSDWLMGFGGGMTFDTAAGIFSLSVALGSRQEVPVDFRRAKIHFGYLSLF